MSVRAALPETPLPLGRRVQFDKKSRQFPVRALAAVAEAKAPRSYTWSCDAQLDQVSSSCTGFSWSHELIARPAVVANITPTFAMNLYYAAQRRDPWPGGEYPGAESFFEGSSVLAAAQVLHEQKFFDEYRWAFGLDDLILALGYAGPAVLGINWYDSMFDPDADGTLHVEGDIAGGHAILANGVSIKRKLVRLHNSWGPDWGANGDALISFDDLGRLLHEDGEACIPVHRHRVAV